MRSLFVLLQLDRETEDSIFSFSYRDAAVVFTDTTIDAPAPAIVVSFRCAVSSSISNY